MELTFQKSNDATPTNESTSAYLDMEMVGRQITEAKELWCEDSMESVFLTLSDAENTIQSAKAKIARVLQSQQKATAHNALETL